MKTNDRGIRTIHDAIDAKTRRITDQLSATKCEMETAITETVYLQIGLTDAYNEIERITGRRPYDNYERGSLLEKALIEARKPLVDIDTKIRHAMLIAENAHIAVVTEDKADVLSNLDEQLKDIK